MLRAKLMKRIPTPGIEPGPRRWERRILTTRPRGRYILDLNRLYFNNRFPADIWLKNAPAFFCMFYFTIMYFAWSGFAYNLCRFTRLRIVFAATSMYVVRGQAYTSGERAIVSRAFTSWFRVLLNNAFHTVCKSACCVGQGLQARIQRRWNGWIPPPPHFSEPPSFFFFLIPEILK